MALLTIAEVAQRTGLKSSAIRYYEEFGILPPAIRVSGQRRYDQVALYRLAVVQRATGRIHAGRDPYPVLRL